MPHPDIQPLRPPSSTGSADAQIPSLSYQSSSQPHSPKSQSNEVSTPSTATVKNASQLAPGKAFSTDHTSPKTLDRAAVPSERASRPLSSAPPSVHELSGSSTYQLPTPSDCSSITKKNLLRIPESSRLSDTGRAPFTPSSGDRVSLNQFQSRSPRNYALAEGQISPRSSRCLSSEEIVGNPSHTSNFSAVDLAKRLERLSVVSKQSRSRVHPLLGNFTKTPSVKDASAKKQVSQRNLAGPVLTHIAVFAATRTGRAERDPANQLESCASYSRWTRGRARSRALQNSSRRRSGVPALITLRKASQARPVEAPVMSAVFDSARKRMHPSPYDSRVTRLILLSKLCDRRIGLPLQSNKSRAQGLITDPATTITAIHACSTSSLENRQQSSGAHAAIVTALAVSSCVVISTRYSKHEIIWDNDVPTSCTTSRQTSNALEISGTVSSGRRRTTVCPRHRHPGAEGHAVGRAMTFGLEALFRRRETRIFREISSWSWSARELSESAIAEADTEYEPLLGHERVSARPGQDMQFKRRPRNNTVIKPTSMDGVESFPPLPIRKTTGEWRRSPSVDVQSLYSPQQSVRSVGSDHSSAKSHDSECPSSERKSTGGIRSLLKSKRVGANIGSSSHVRRKSSSAAAHIQRSRTNLSNFLVKSGSSVRQSLSSNNFRRSSVDASFLAREQAHAQAEAEKVRSLEPPPPQRPTIIRASASDPATSSEPLLPIWRRVSKDASALGALKRAPLVMQVAEAGTSREDVISAPGSQLQAHGNTLRVEVGGEWLA